MEGENQKNPQTKRLTIWAIIMLVLSLIVILTLEVDQARELFLFFAEIIIHLIVG
jgi:hypothetical protein